MEKPRISIIAAIGRNRVLGKDNRLLWNIPADLKRFKALTLGHPIIMGRKTYDSILETLGKPLPGRTSIVVTRQPLIEEERYHRSEYAESVEFASSLEEAIEKAKEAPGSEEIFLGGGGQIYGEAMPLVDKLYLTLIEDDKEGDSYFPAYETEFPKVMFDESHECEGLKYRWIDLERLS
jgi:dihydrofolate reductase